MLEVDGHGLSSSYCRRPMDVLPFACRDRAIPPLLGSSRLTGGCRTESSAAASTWSTCSTRINWRAGADRLVDLLQVLVVVRRNDHRLDAVAEGRHGLFPQSADGQHPAPQRYLAGHGHVPASPVHPVRADTMAVVMAMPAEGPVLGDRPLGEVDMDVPVLVEICRQCPAESAWLRI